MFPEVKSKEYAINNRYESNPSPALYLDGELRKAQRERQYHGYGNQMGQSLNEKK